MSRLPLALPGAVLAALVALSLGGCEEKVTIENYELIEVGMAQHQVESILGPGDRQDVTGAGIDASGLVGRTGEEGTRSTYLWEEGGRQIIITFEDQEVRSKRKTGF